MDITPIFITGIVFCAIYKVFDLFVRRKERIMLIEKINPETSGQIDLNKISGLLNPQTDNRFTALKWGMLGIGLGLGLFVSVLIASSNPNIEGVWSLNATLNGSLTLLGGGLGLVIAFVIEMVIRNKEKGQMN